MESIFSIMSYGGMILAVISLIVAVILFIRWDIPKIFGDLTGRSEKKTIERIRREGYEMNTSTSATGKRKVEVGTIRVRKTKSDTVGQETSGAETTALLSTNNTGAETTALLSTNNSGEEATTLLSGNSSEEETTTILNATSMEGEYTTVLNGNPASGTAGDATKDEGITGVIHLPEVKITPMGKIEKVLDFMIAHTDEIVS